MHPPSLFSFVTSRRFIPFFIVFVLFFTGFFFILQISPGGFQKEAYVVASPTPIVVENLHWQTHTNTQDGYSIQLPQDLSKNILAMPKDKFYTFTYQVDGENYIVTVFPPGGLHSIENGMEPTSITQTRVSYGGRQFIHELWTYSNQKSLLRVIPNEQGFSFNSFVIEVPSTDTKRYVAIFDQMFRSLKFTGDLTPPLTPLPTIQ